jgi:predicted ATPase
MLADAYRVAGQPDAALATLAEAERAAEATQIRWALAETLRLRGDLLAQTGDRIAAEASFHASIALARRQSAKLFELRAATSLARLWRGQGRTVDAHDLLVPIFSWFTEGFDAPDLAEAKALLDELGVGHY